MNADALVAISAAVVACVQMSKWAGMRDSFGPLAVIGFSGLGVVVWLFSQDAWPPARTETWPIVAGWISVALGAAGVFGFTRASASAVIRATTPPADGAGSSATVTEAPPVDVLAAIPTMSAADLAAVRDAAMARHEALMAPANDPLPPNPRYPTDGRG
jgi:hypothetical protein